MGLTRRPERAVLYGILPVTDDGVLAALDVTLTLPGDRDGVTELTLPTAGMADGEGPAYLQDLVVTGGTLDPVNAMVRRVKNMRRAAS